jgi:hypothetical protein
MATDNAADLPPTDTWAPPSIVGHGVVFTEMLLVARFCPLISAQLPGDNDVPHTAFATTPIVTKLATVKVTVSLVWPPMLSVTGRFPPGALVGRVKLTW